MNVKLPAPFLFDGAFGTYYFSLTSNPEPCERANLTDRETVRRIHRDYIAAGVSAIKTNTFAANPSMAQGEELRELLAAGWSIAQEAARGTAVRIFADIGGMDTETAAQDYLTVAKLFLELGAHDFLFETLHSYEEIVPAVTYIKENAPDATVIVSFAVSQDGYTKRGLSYQMLLRKARENDSIDAAGLNCVCGPSHMLALARALPPHAKPFAAMPNSGYPSALNGRVMFVDNADYFAQKLAGLYSEGADVLGGCCGSTPRHMKLSIDAISHAQRPLKATVPPKTGMRETPPAGTEQPPRRKLIAVELDPPLDYDCSFLLSAAAELKNAGVDLITIADSPLSRTRADSLMTAAKVRREVGVEVLPHLSCRDKNQIALKAGLLGAAFEGINQVLVVTGDPPPQSDTRRSEGVFSFNSFDLIAYIDSMNHDVFTERPFLIGGALNVNAVHFEAELARAEKKLERGAQMLLTQPVFSDAAVENFLRAREKLDCTLLAGILPLANYRNALFLINEVSGIEIPDEVLRALEGKTPAQSMEISIAYSTGVIRKLEHAADGFYIMTPLKKVEIVRGLIEKIRSKERC